jgi:1-acyl-sn-glycerol-3-phosphate acyltransferase
MQAIRSVIYNIYFYVLVVLMVILWIPLLILGPREASLTGFRILTRCLLWGLEKICGTKMEIRGRENLPKNRPVIIASKHQSLWDIVIYFAILDNPVLISKREIKLIPIFGFYASKIGTIMLDRSAAAKALKTMIDDVGAALEKKRTVVIFPEGTRMAPGAEPDYKPGIAALYTRLDHGCVPVALNSGVFWPRRKMIRYPGTIILEFLPVIEPGLKRKEFMTTLQTSIEEASQRLLDEATAPHDAA